MAGFIFAIFGAIIGMLPHNSMAQLDFEDLLSVSAPVEEETAPADSAPNTEEEKETTKEDTADTDEVPTLEADDEETEDEEEALEPEDEEKAEETSEEDTEETAEETVDTIAAEDSPQAQSLTEETAAAEEVAAEVAEDDFMAQLISEVEQKEAAPKSEAMRLMMQKDNASVLPDDMEKLFEESAKIRQRQRELLMHADSSEAEESEESEEEESEENTEETAEVTETPTDTTETKAETTEETSAPTEKAEKTADTSPSETTVKPAEDTQTKADTGTTPKAEETKEVPAAKPAESVAAAPSAPTPAKAQDDKAPFGLTWGASTEQTQEAGFELEDIKFGEYVGTRLIKNPQQKQRTIFDKIVVVFGTRNRLNAVFAQSPSVSDLPNADRVLKIYHSYYTALAKKYGNDKEHFIANKESEDSAIGNDGFLKDLYEGKTSLFATFHNENIRITLAVAASSESESYITLDYENTLMEQQEKDDNLNELMNDL